MSLGSWLGFGGGNVEILFAATFGCVGAAALLYSIARVRGGAGLNAEYYILLLLLVGSAIGTAFARNLLVLFTLWELATLAVWRLVAFHRRDEDVIAAEWTWYVNFGAATLMIVALARIAVQYGTLDLDRLRGGDIGLAASVLLLIGILAKSATLPLYVWLPRAYKAAPAPVCALLSGVAENIGIVLFLKVFLLAMRVPSGFMGFVAGLAVVSSLVAGGVALNAATTRGVLAYSTVAQLGFVLLGVAVAGYYGLLGAVLYVSAHALAKSGLFFSIGLVEDATGTFELDRLGGVARHAPVLAAVSAALVLSIMGIPPFLGFFAKLSVVLGTVRFSLLLGAGAMIAALFTILYMVRLYTRVFLGVGTGHERIRFPAFPVAIVTLLAVISLLGGVLYYIPLRFLEQQVVGLAGSL